MTSIRWALALVLVSCGEQGHDLCDRAIARCAEYTTRGVPGEREALCRASEGCR